MGYFVGSTPEKCERCGDKIEDVFVDGQLRHLGCWIWGYACPICHAKHGCGFGKGRGQKFQKQPDGKFMKVEG